MGAELWDSAWGGFTARSDTPAGPADIPALPGGRQSPGCSASAASGSGRLIHPAGSGAICGAGLQLPLTQVQPPTGAAFGAALAPSPPGWAVPRARCRDGDTDGAAGAGWPQSGVPPGTARLAHTASLSPHASWKRSSRPRPALCCVSQAAAGQQAPGSLWLAHAGHRGGSDPRGLRRAGTQWFPASHGERPWQERGSLGCGVDTEGTQPWKMEPGEAWERGPEWEEGAGFPVLLSPPANWALFPHS